MARHIAHPLDDIRTELLGQEELFVEKGLGDDNYYVTWNLEPEVECCPICSGKAIKTQDLFSKTYIDIIQPSPILIPVKIQYKFYKYRCLNENCRHIFAHEIGFASKEDNVTYRLENEIAKRVINGSSYEQVSNQLDGMISRQAVGQIFNRWEHKKESTRKFRNSISKLGIISGKLKDECYTIILNLDNGIRVYDILYGISSGDIAAEILRLGPSNIKTVFSDCNPIIVSTILDNLPNVDYVIPVDYWFSLVTEDFRTFASERIKWCNVPHKEELILIAPTELGFKSGNIDRLMEARPMMKKPYEDYNRLRRIITRRDELWIFNELLEWVENIDADFKAALEPTIMQLELYRPQIEAQLQHQDELPERLFYLTERLEKILSNKKYRNFSAEVLKARVLYSIETNLENWQGVAIEEIITHLESNI